MLGFFRFITTGVDVLHYIRRDTKLKGGTRSLTIVLLDVTKRSIY